MAGGSPLKSYAKDLVLELQGEITAANNRDLPPVEVMDCISSKPLQFRAIRNSSIFDEDDLHWTIHPSTVRAGQSIATIRTNKHQAPIVLGILNGAGPDPLAHPNGDSLARSVKKIKSQTGSWKAPVISIDQLPEEGNGHGDVRIVTNQRALYTWGADSKIWKPLTGDASAGAVDPTKLPLVGGTLTGDLIMASGTDIILPDLPTSPTQAANKAYVDSMLSSTALTVTSVSSNYAVAAGDDVILVNTSGIRTITLPATHTAGTVYYIKDATGGAATNNITITATAPDTLDGSTTLVVSTAWHSITVVSDGTNWFSI